MANEYSNRANQIASNEQNLWTGIGGIAGQAAGAMAGGGAGGAVTPGAGVASAGGSYSDFGNMAAFLGNRNED